MFQDHECAEGRRFIGGHFAKQRLVWSWHSDRKPVLGKPLNFQQAYSTNWSPLETNWSASHTNSKATTKRVPTLSIIVKDTSSVCGASASATMFSKKTSLSTIPLADAFALCKAVAKYFEETMTWTVWGWETGVADIKIWHSISTLIWWFCLKSHAWKMLRNWFQKLRPGQKCQNETKKYKTKTHDDIILTWNTGNCFDSFTTLCLWNWVLSTTATADRLTAADFW